MRRRELVQMLHLNRKAEIQILSAGSSYDGIEHLGGMLENLFGEEHCVTEAEEPLTTTKHPLVEYIVHKICSGCS